MNVTFARYSRLMMALHWATAVLVVAAYLLSEGGPRVRTHPPLLHFACGLAVLLLLVPRLIARALGAVPPLPQYDSRWLTIAARASHTLLYLLLLAVPLMGWYVASRLGVPAWLFGLTLPPLTAAVAGPAGILAKLHQVGGNLILILAGVHALAALWHHFGLRDHTLRRMTPF
ncbi:MAG TPA: cytochrome b [Steroidobacteraceae bacterium]|jgi:cytochrome b561|nr:cytochrome b [Steroidobacteraceae bacterium]